MRYEAILNLRNLTPEQRAEKRKEYEQFERFWKPHCKQAAAQYRHNIEVLDRIEAELVEEVLA